MRWFITFLLLLLVATCGAWLFYGDQLLQQTGWRPAAQNSPADSQAIRLLEALRPEAIQKLELMPPGAAPLTLTRSSDGRWNQDGNWPVRTTEVSALLNLLCSLQTRFIPISITAETTDLSPYGLAPEQKFARVIVHLDNRAMTLRFGQPPVSDKKPNREESQFSRPTFVQIDNLPEVLQLGPDVYPLVSRSPEVYRRRQLFPDATRLRLTGGKSSDPFTGTTPDSGRVLVLGDAFQAIHIHADKPQHTSFLVKRVAPTPLPRRDPSRPTAEPAVSADDLALAWELELSETRDNKPLSIRDAIEPSKLRTVLTAVADLWVEKFVSQPPVDSGLGAGQTPAFTIRVQHSDGRATTLLLGKVSRTVTRTSNPPPAQPFAPPPPARITTEEYRYAKLEGNDLVFEIRTDRLSDWLSNPQTLRDPRVARFDTAAVQSLTIQRPGQAAFVLTRKPGNPQAENFDARQDRWYVGDMLAEASTVSELVEDMSRWQTEGEQRLDAPDEAKLKELGLLPPSGFTITVKLQAKTVEGDPPAPERTIIYELGRDSPESPRFAVRVTGRSRVNLLEDAIYKKLDRPALAYRGRRLFDTADTRLERVAVRPAGHPGFTLRQPASGKSWELTEPITSPTDSTKAEQFTGTFARLEATEYIDETPSAENLAGKYGLSAPRYTVDLLFSGDPPRNRSLAIGAVRDQSETSYARLDGQGSVFTIPNSLVQSLEAGALALLPTELWSTLSDRITAIEIRRGPQGNNDSYRIARDGTAWKLTGPFDASVSFPELQPLLAAISTVKAEKAESLTVSDPATYGFDRPSLRLAVTFTLPPPIDSDVEPAKPETPQTQTLLIGKPTTDAASSYYARLDDPARPSVYVISNNLLRQVDQPALHWLDRNLLSLEPEQITRVQLLDAKQTEVITLVRNDAGNWIVEGNPFALDAPTMDALLATAARPPLSRLAAYGNSIDWNRYGLNTPELTIRLTRKPSQPGAEAKTHTLKLGKSEPGGERSLRVDDTPAVGMLSAQAAAQLMRQRLDFVDRTLFNFDPAMLTSIRRSREQETLTLEQTGLNWELTQPVKQKADQPTLEDLANRLSRLRGDAIAAYDPKPADLEKFGLAKPVATITLTVGLDTPKEYLLKLGAAVDPKATDSGRYAIAVPPGAKSPTSVAILPASLANQLLAEPLRFRDKTLARFVDADRIFLQRGDRKITFAKVGGLWKVTDPISADAEQGELDELINTVARLRAEELVAENPNDKKPFRLDPPELTWKFFADGKEVLALSVSSPDPTTATVFVQAAGSNLIARLDRMSSDRLLAEYRRREVFTDLDASVMSSLAVSGTSGHFVLQRQEDGTWIDRERPNDPINMEKLNETLSAIALLKASPYVVDTGAQLELYGLKEPKRVIVVTQRNGVSKTLHLGGPVAGSNGKQIYGRVVEPGRSDVFVLSPDATEKLSRERNAFRK